MIRAKADGHNLLPIALHAAIHAVLIATCVVLAYGIKMGLIAFMIEWVTHFIVDVSKGRIMFRFKAFSDFSDKRYWMLFGLDQLIHLYVLIFILYYVS